MKKVALISSFCDSKEKTDILIENIIKIKNLGVDVMVFSPLKLDDKIIELSDYVILSKENPVLNWPEKSMFQWWNGSVNGLNIQMTTTYPDYGFAGLVQVKRMADLALSMDYDLFFPMIYDINITENVEGVFKSHKKNSFFPSKRDNTIWDVGLHLISLDRDHLTRFKNLITKESYLVEGDFDAFAWLHRAVKLIPGVIEKEPIEDLIYCLINKNFFNISPSKKFSCFIHKTNVDNMKIVFYNFAGLKKFTIETDHGKSEHTVREWDQIELPYFSCKSLKVENDGNTFDFTTELKQIGHNEFKIS